MNLKSMKKAELMCYIQELEDKVQDLNLKYKYAEFDSEASKREIQYLKKLLEQKENEEEK